MENFSINFLIKETKKTLEKEIFVNKVKLKKEFLIFNTKSTNIIFPLTPKSPPFFLSDKGNPGKEAKNSEINVFRKYLENSIITEITKPFHERVIFFKVKKMMIWGEKKDFFFIVNCATLPHKWYITDENKKIIFSKNDENAVSGTLFLMPETDKEDFSEEKLSEIDKLSPLEIAKKFKGFSKTYAKELKKRKDRKEFWEKILTAESEGGFLYKKGCYPLKMETLSPEIKIFESFNQCLETEFFEKLNKGKIASLKKKIIKKLKKEIEKKKKLLKKLEKEIEDAKKGEKLLKTAELLSANFHLLKRGEKSVRVFDFYQNEEREIPLDPNLSPKENVSRLYRKATKFIKKKPIIEKRVKEIEAEIHALKDNLYLAENAENMEDLSGFEDKKAKKTQKNKKEIGGIERIDLEDGFFVYVGKNSNANHTIYTQKLSKNDLWFHAKDIPGSHVVLKNTKNLPPEEIPDEIIEKAAKIAAYHSKGRNDSLVEVQYTTKDNLYSSKGKGAGFVLLRNFKTINVKPSKNGQ